MLTFYRPADFVPKLQVVGCFIECGDEFLMLYRHERKPQGKSWGMPAGKVRKGESLPCAIAREVFEETGIRARSEDFSFFKTAYVCYEPDFTFEFHMFSLSLTERPCIRLEASAHTDSCWMTPEAALERKDLMPEVDHCIKLYFNVTGEIYAPLSH